ncbi:RHS repeat-associated core domain-containing protein [Bradyrhizobium oligotrophicum]|uniref:RHS repeat-associated core domain-containing protein n=1 Tax=Bradyrhizobium oligotrophicum TaxID=44255 RepID=UPI003EC0EB26
MIIRRIFRRLAAFSLAIVLPTGLGAQPARLVGTIGGSFDVSLSGTSTYTIPIRVAPGAAGTEPKLALTYDSQAPAGSLGAGWSVTGISTIARGPKTRFVDGVVEGVDLSDNDALYLDGQRLIPIKKTGSGPGRRIEFRKEIDDQSQIIQLGTDISSSRFVVRTKGGLTILFDGDTPSFATGGTNNSRVMFPGGPTFLLAASRIIDTAGNFIQFEYNQGDGDYDVARVYYTAHGSLSETGDLTVDRNPFAVVTFEYEAAPRLIESYVAGFVYKRKTRLKSIASLATSNPGLPVANWSQASRYLLEYEDRPTTSNRFVLTSVTQFGADGSTIEPTRFTYSGPAIGWKEPSFALPVGTAFATRYQLAGAYKFTRFTDSALRTPDLLFSAQIGGRHEAFAYQNNAGTWADAPAGFKPPFPFTNSDGADLGALLLDVNGDAKPDLLQSHKPKDASSDRSAYLADTNGWTKADGYVLPFDLSREGKRIAKILTARLSGAAGPDVLFESGGQSGFLRNAGTGWQSVNDLKPPLPLDAYSRLIDVDCDGKLEFVGVDASAGAPRWRVFRFSSTKWNEELDEKFGPQQIPASTDPQAIQDINFPGTTCAGLIAATAQNGGFRIALQPNAGGWDVSSRTPIFDLVDQNGRPAKPVITDVNGDGRLDVIAHQIDPQSTPIKLAYAQTAAGWAPLQNSFEPPPLGSLDPNALPFFAYIGDLDGDSRPDIVLPGGSGASLGRVWKGTTSGFEEIPDYGPKVPFSRRDKQDRGIRILDLNADGLPDIVFNRETADSSSDPFAKGAFINTGKGWLSAPGFIPPLPFASDHILGNPVQFVDVDGDGFVDMLYSYRKAGGELVRAYFRNEPCKLDTTEDPSICGEVSARDVRFNRKWVKQEGSAFTPPDGLPFAEENIGDLGVRFVDLDGDGRVDLIAGMIPPAPSPIPPIENCRDENGIQICELNRSIFRVSAFLNTGSGWARAPQYDPPLPFVGQFANLGSRTRELSVELIDVDGDRLPDIVAGSKHPYSQTKDIFEVWRNTGAGWRIDGSISLPNHTNGTRLFLDEGSRDSRASIQWADVNGDGLADIVFTRLRGATNESETFLSTGRGFVLNGDWKIPTDALLDRDGDSGLRLIDMNGDGLLDVLYSRQISGSKQTGLFVNNGSGWVGVDSAIVQVLPAFVDQDGNDLGIRALDVDGNGILDVVESYVTADSPGATRNKVLLNTGRRTDVLASIDAGYGLKTTLFYQSMLEANPDGIGENVTTVVPWNSVYVPGTPQPYPIITPVPATYVVRRAVVAESSDRTIGFSYRYGDFRMHALAMRSLGFGWRESFNEDPNSRIVTRVELLQDIKQRNNPVREAACHIPVDFDEATTTPSNRTRPFDSSRSNLCPAVLDAAFGSVRKLSETANVWAVREGEVGGVDGLPRHTIRQLHLAKTSSVTFELDGGVLTSQTDTFRFDEPGDILQRRLNALETLSERGDGTSVRTTNEYGEDSEARWFFGRLTKAVSVKTGDQITSDSPARSQESRTATFGYDRRTGLLRYEAKNTDVPEKAVTSTYERDSYGNVVATQVSAFGEQPRTSQKEFDTLGRFAAADINALGHRITRTYNEATGAQTSTTNSNGLTTRFEYDAFGRLVSETSPMGTTTTTTFLKVSDLPDANAARSGLATAVYVLKSQSSGTAASFKILDSKGRILRTIADGYTSDASATRPIQRDVKYDSLGRTLGTTLPYERGKPMFWATAQYDLLGRVKEASTPSGATTKTTFRSRTGGGSIVTITDPLGRQTTSESNMRRLTVAVTDALQGKMTYSYDAGDRLLRFVGPGGAVTSHSYDAVGQRVGTSDPDSGNWQYSYDPFGRLVRQVDAKRQVTTVEYDLLGRPLRKAQNDIVSWWEYDTAAHGIGMVASITGADGYKESSFYDEFGRKASWSVTVNNETFSTSTEYDRQGRVNRTLYPDGFGVQNVYDAKGYLTEVRDSRKATAYWKVSEIDHYGRVARDTYGNGFETIWTFEDQTSRPKQLQATKSGNTIVDLNLQFDLVGNLSRREEKIGLRTGQPIVETFEYDALDRLTSMTKSNAARERYAFDASGRFTFKSGIGDYSYVPSVVPATRVIEDTDAKPFHAVEATQLAGTRTSYGYDANGSLVRSPAGILEYTADNRLKTIFADQARWVRFDYSPSGSRYRQFERVGPESRETIYVGAYERVTQFTGALTEARRGRITRHRHYLTNSEGVFAAVELNSEYADVLDQENTRPGSPVKPPWSRLETTKVWYLHRDQLGSVLKISDEAGRVAASYWYDPWGKRTAYVNDPTGDTRSGLKLEKTWDRGFTGHEHRDAYSLVHMNGRVFDSALANFTSVDLITQSLGDSQTTNGYQYARRNPLRYVDPTGLGFDPIGAIVGGVVGFFVGGPAGAVAGFIIGGSAQEVGKWVKEHWREVLIITVTIAVAVVASPLGPVAAGLIAGAVQGALSSYLYGGSTEDILAGAFKGAVVGAMMGGIAYGVQTGALNPYAAAAMTAHVSGVSAAANGGDYWTGAKVSLITSAGAATLQQVPQYDSSPAARIAGSAALGGTAAELSGDKFENGAVTGAYQGVVSEVARMHAERRERSLTFGERRLIAGADEISNLDMDKARVVRGRYMLFQFSETAMSPDGKMYFPERIYCPDFSICGADNYAIRQNRGWFLHESTHVWQTQQGTNVALEGLMLRVQNPLTAIFSTERLYKPNYGIPFKDNNIEQQGDWVKDKHWNHNPY